jgi:superfamily II DNA or RNA helicase
MSIKFELDRAGRQGIVSGDHFNEIREHFSVKNDAAKFARFRGRYMPSRTYIITPTGKFDPGMYKEISQFIFEQQYNTDIIHTKDFAHRVKPEYTEMAIPVLNLQLRDYQRDIVNKCTSNGRGVVVLATAGGKTLTIASLLQSIYSSNKEFKCALIVPDRGLVSQTYTDFAEYGVSFLFSKWTGNDELNMSSNVIICNMGILQSNKSNTDWLSFIDICIVDEVHKLRRGNKINKLFKEIRTPNVFGFTGTMPEELVDQWNIIGKVGPIIYKKDSYELRKDNYISDVKIQILEIEYAAQPKYPRELKDPSDRYRAEVDFLTHNDFRNNIITSLCKRVDNNTLVLVDYIEHGTLLHRFISDRCKDKRVYFIRGEVDIEDRDKVKQLMEEEDDIIVVAISKIFSTGINIKNLHYIVFASGGKAKIKTIQSIGRGLRLHKNKTKLIIFDIGDDLRYGKQHLAKRLSHYEKESIEYGIQTFTEKNS